MSDFDARMALLNDRFVARAPDEARMAEACLAAQDWEGLRTLCHGLAGRAGMFGHSDLGELAARTEAAVEQGAGAVTLCELGSALVAALRIVAQER